MDRYGADGVVDLDAVEERDGEADDEARGGPDDHRAEGSDVGAGSRDRDKPGQRAVDAHGEVGLPEHRPGGEARRDHAGGGGEVGRDGDARDGVRVGGHGAARIEAEPAEPEDEAAQGDEGHAMARDGRHLSAPAVFAQPGSQDDDSGEPGPSADRVNDGRAGEVEEAQFAEPATAPDPVSLDGVDDGDEREAEDHESRELDPLGDAAGDDGGGGGREDELEEEFGVEGNPRPVEGGDDPFVGVSYGGTVVGAGEEEAVRAEKQVAVAEHEGEANHPEGEGRDGDDAEVFVQDGDGVFRPAES